MHRIFKAFSEVEHPNYAGPLFEGDGLKNVSAYPVITEAGVQILKAFGTMLFYGFVHGSASMVSTVRQSKLV